MYIHNHTYGFDKQGHLKENDPGDKSGIKEFDPDKKTRLGGENRHIVVDGQIVDKNSLITQLNIEIKRINEKRGSKLPTLSKGRFLGSNEEKIRQVFNLVSNQIRAENNIDENIKIIESKGFALFKNANNETTIKFNNPQEKANFIEKNEKFLSEDAIKNSSNLITKLTLSPVELENLSAQINKENRMQEAEKFLPEFILLLKDFGVKEGRIDSDDAGVVLHFNSREDVKDLMFDSGLKIKWLEGFHYKLSLEDAKKLAEDLQAPLDLKEPTE